MGMLWNEEVQNRYERFRHSMEAWEVLHEEAGFEDTGEQGDHMLSDLDGAETHMEFMEVRPSQAMEHG